MHDPMREKVLAAVRQKNIFMALDAATLLCIHDALSIRDATALRCSSQALYAQLAPCLVQRSEAERLSEQHRLPAVREPGMRLAAAVVSPMPSLVASAFISPSKNVENSGGSGALAPERIIEEFREMCGGARSGRLLATRINRILDALLLLEQPSIRNCLRSMGEPVFTARPKARLQIARCLWWRFLERDELYTLLVTLANGLRQRGRLLAMPAYKAKPYEIEAELESNARMHYDIARYAVRLDDAPFAKVLERLFRQVDLLAASHRQDALAGIAELARVIPARYLSRELNEYANNY